MMTTNESGQSIVAGRYTIGRTLGRGGVAIVCHAHDAISGREVALKRLLPDPDSDAVRRRRSLELFEREFHTLSQLRHPNVVAAYDFGVDRGDPYYTMELLSGGDLVDRAPLPYVDACRLARDVCSALSLIHSRRMVYRDLSPRNVRCDDGTAKLLDFGAMTAMGPTRFFVGTLAVSAPEAIHVQPLDARADLYSLGATLYYALTGRHPFPARTPEHLVQLWSSTPAAPSTVVPGIPEALDALVLQLLQLDAAHRPASASEVMDRLSAIAGGSSDESQIVSSAYLVTPTLVGRQFAIDRMQQSLNAALEGHGGSLFVQGPSGSGRSRFLDACVLAGKIAGAVVVRADSNDVLGGEYDVVRALDTQLAEALPVQARAAAESAGSAVLRVLPSLRQGAVSSPPAAPGETMSKVQLALRDWFLALSSERPLVVAVDDAHRIDAQSAAVIALLSRATSGRSLLVVTTACSDEGLVLPAAVNLIADASLSIRLHRLTKADSETMLRSVFGDVPHVSHVARRIHEVSHGKPRDIMLLAQHLLDRGVVRYHGGTWSLPESLDADDLPDSLAKAIRERVQALTPAARELAQAMALAAPTRYSLEDCARLVEATAMRDVLVRLDELVSADLVSAAAGHYRLSRDGMQSAILSGLDFEKGRALHLRLAGLFEERKASDLVVASHYLRAGREERALDLLVAHAETSTKITDASTEAYVELINSLPHDWLRSYDWAVGLCHSYGRPRSQAMALHVRVVGIAGISKIDANHHFAALFEQLRHDTGLDLYDALEGKDPGERLQGAFGGAMQRYASLPEHERCADPATSIRLLARAITTGIGNVGITLSQPLADLLPSLTPLMPLSPALAVVQKMTDGLRARLIGANDVGREIYGEIIERLSHDSCGMDPTYAEMTRRSLTFVLATMEASMGLESSLARAQTIEQSPLHEVSAAYVRLLYHLWQGDVREADRWKERVEVLNVERVRPQGADGAHLIRELPAHAAMENLTRVRQTLDTIQGMAARLPGWRPVLHWARAEYERIRGDLPAALRETEQSLGSMAPEGHAVWADVTACHLRTLLALGEAERARALGLDYLEKARARRVGHWSNAIAMPLAIALAVCGDAERAVAVADETIAYYEGIGSKGINPFLGHEARARVAAVLGDRAGRNRHVELCKAQIPAGGRGSLTAKFERLVRETSSEGGDSQAVSSNAAASDFTLTRTRLMSILSTEPDAGVRARKCLELLIEASGAREGYLYVVQEKEISFAAQIAKAELPEKVKALAGRFLEAELSEDTTTTAGENAAKDDSEWRHGASVYRPMILGRHLEHGFDVVGLAVLCADPQHPFRYPNDVAREVAGVLAMHDGAESRRLHS